MREIKFRAWLEKDKCMLHHSDFTIEPTFPTGVRIVTYSSEWIMKGGDPYERPTEERHEDAVLMQYTGLKDKNGVEIFENDICKVLYSDWIDPVKETRTLSVHYDTNGFYFSPEIGGYSETMEVGPRGRVEVIGNIYQHPHLLTENK